MLTFAFVFAISHVHMHSFLSRPSLCACARAVSAITSAILHILAVNLHRIDQVCQVSSGVRVCDVELNVFDHVDQLMAILWPMSCAVRESRTPSFYSTYMYIHTCTHIQLSVHKCSRAHGDTLDIDEYMRLRVCRCA